jgi:hypothetical protein
MINQKGDGRGCSLKFQQYTLAEAYKNLLVTLHTETTNEMFSMKKAKIKFGSEST